MRETCNNAASFGVTTQDRKLCACTVHLPEAVKQGGYVQPLHDAPFTCELPRKFPFGFGREGHDQGNQ